MEEEGFDTGVRVCVCACARAYVYMCVCVCVSDQSKELLVHSLNGVELMYACKVSRVHTHTHTHTHLSGPQAAILGWYGPTIVWLLSWAKDA